MATNSIVTATGDGTTTDFNFSFTGGYLDFADVRVRVGVEVDGTGNPVYRSRTLISPGRLRIGGAAPGNGVNIKIFRQTAVQKAIVDFANGTILDDVSLDLGFKQLVNVCQELKDAVGDSKAANDAVAAANAAQDIAVAAQTSATASKTASKASETASKASELAAAGSAQSASASATAAAASAATASNVVGPRLTQLANVNPTLNTFIVGNGSAWTGETPSQVRASLSLGTLALQAANAVNITGGTIAGNGSGLTSLNASRLTSGTVPYQRLGRASTAEAQAGTNTTKLMSPATTKAAIQQWSSDTRTSRYSANIPSGNIAYAHALGGIPDHVDVYIRARASFAGYSAGDMMKVNVGTGVNSPDDQWIAVTATQVILYNFDSVRYRSRSQNLTNSASNANWQLVCIATRDLA